MRTLKAGRAAHEAFDGIRAAICYAHECGDREWWKYLTEEQLQRVLDASWANGELGLPVPSILPWYERNACNDVLRRTDIVTDLHLDRALRSDYRAQRKTHRALTQLHAVK